MIIGMRQYPYNQIQVILFLFSILYLPTACDLTPEYCCELGARNSQHSRLCVDYTALSQYATNDTCKYFYTICCNQNNRYEECERGKALAHRQESCYDPSRLSINSFETYNDAFSECCSCCHLGIVVARNGLDCKSNSFLPDYCNKIFLDCCGSQLKNSRLSGVKSMLNGTIEPCLEPCSVTQECVQTANGAECVCINGYEMNPIRNECEDINECETRIPCPSESNCTNTIGSFICSRSCSLGFVFDSAIGRCRDINECAMNIHKCLKGMRCENIPGAYRCIRETPCGTGYAIDSFTQDCIDIDECALKIDGCPPGFLCQNFIGSFRCKPRECGNGEIFNYDVGICEPLMCSRGYVVHNSSGECADENECDTNPDICKLSEICENTPGSYRCVQKISCDRGYDATKDGCIDIDECETRKHTCPETATCINKVGSYSCVCPTGYDIDITGTRCDDIDECSLGYGCPRNAKCVNTIGSYECRCNLGFQMVNDTDNKYCRDVDECQTAYLCQHRCVNAYGSYQCVCNEGYSLANDKKTCADIDECKLHKNLCMGTCTNTIGSFECSCNDGFELDRTYKRMCYDIDECTTARHNCNLRERCLNTRGSYKCLRIECPPGYYLAGGFQTTRCDRANTVCRNEDNECIRKPMRIFHHYISFSYKVAIPVKIFTPPPILLPHNGRHHIRYDLKLVNNPDAITSSFNSLRSTDFHIRYLGTTSIEVMLQKPPLEPQEIRLELTAEIYTSGSFQTAVLNKLFLFITE